MVSMHDVSQPCIGLAEAAGGSAKQPCMMYFNHDLALKHASVVQQGQSRLVAGASNDLADKRPCADLHLAYLKQTAL